MSVSWKAAITGIAAFVARGANGVSWRESPLRIRYHQAQQRGGELLLRVFGFVQPSQLDWIQQLLDLFLGERVLLADNLQDALAALARLDSELGSLFVADDRIERGGEANGRFHVMREHFLVHRDAIDTLVAEQLRRIEKEAL